MHRGLRRLKDQRLQVWPVVASDEFDDPGRKACTQIKSRNRNAAFQSVSSLPPGAKTARICKHTRLLVDFVGQGEPFPTEFSNVILAKIEDRTGRKTVAALQLFPFLLLNLLVTG